MTRKGKVSDRVKAILIDSIDHTHTLGHIHTLGHSERATYVNLCIQRLRWHMYSPVNVSTADSVR